MKVSVKTKRMKALNNKIANAKNNVVVKYLNLHGYNVNNTTESIKEIYNQFKREGKKIILEKENEHFFKNGSYFVWEADIIVKEA